jgi:hypothetical protein
MIARIVLALIASIALCFTTGCFKSLTTQASLGSSSDSSSSPFKSSSKSSSGDDEEDEKKDDEDQKEETAFQRDVRNYTVEFAQAGDEHDIESFQRGLGAIAEGYGITDWEQAEDTFVAIGRGLGKSELDDKNAKQLAVALSNEDYDHLMLIRSGYESRRTW